VKATRDAVDFPLKLSALTPFTVGSGRILNRFDFTLTMNPRSGAPLIRVIDIERFIEEGKGTPEKKIEAIEKRQAGSLDRFSRYILSCQFRNAQESIELIEFSRDPNSQPLVPASALRGLLRTVLAFVVLKENPEALQEGIEGAMEGRWRRDGASGKLERRIFGRSEFDVMKALEVRDPAPLSKEDIRAYEASVMTMMGSSFRPKTSIFLEALNPDSGEAFEFGVSMDRSYLERRARDAGGRPTSDPFAAACASHLKGPSELLQAMRNFSEALIEWERRFYVDANARDLGRIFTEVIRKAEGRVVLPFGFGAGWRSKTVGALFETQQFTRLAPLLSPRRPYYRRGPRPIFPKTRRWILDGGRPAQPLGWVIVE